MGVITSSLGVVMARWRDGPFLKILRRALLHLSHMLIGYFFNPLAGRSLLHVTYQGSGRCLIVAFEEFHFGKPSMRRLWLLGNSFSWFFWPFMRLDSGGSKIDLIIVTLIEFSNQLSNVHGQDALTLQVCQTSKLVSFY
jgi:hypothetical protein